MNNMKDNDDDGKNNGHSIMVFPANGQFGYHLCEELCKGENKKMRCEQVLCVCMSNEGPWIEKLHKLGKNAKVIVIDQPARFLSWRDKLEFERADCAMIITDPSVAMHPSGQNDNSMLIMSRALENCCEMAGHMCAEALCCVTTFCAEDPKYRAWHRMYKCVEECMFRMDFCDRAAIFGGMPMDALLMNAGEIQQNKTLSWPVSPNAQACMVSMHDLVMASVMVIHELMGEGPGDKDGDDKKKKPDDGHGGDNDGDGKKHKKHKKKPDEGDGGDGDDDKDGKKHKKGKKNKKPMFEEAHGGKFYITGRDSMTPQAIIGALSTSLKGDLKFNQVREFEYRRMLQQANVPAFVAMCLLEMFDMMESGNLTCTDDFNKLTGKAPMRFEEWAAEHRKDFEQRTSRL